MDQSEERWEADRVLNGWILPAPAPRLFRLWGLRHIRALWMGVCIERHNAQWRRIGMVPTGYDEWVLYAIIRGKC